MRARAGSSIVLTLALLVGACGEADVERGERVGEPAADGPVAVGRRIGALHFVDSTVESGLAAFRQRNGDPEKVFITGSVGGGVAALDHDGDGDLDVYLANGALPADREGKEEPPRDALLENLGAAREDDGARPRFEEATAEAGLGHDGWTCGVRTVDHDGDGATDLFLACYGPNVLYRNGGDGTFADVTEGARLDHDGWSTGAAFLDFDRDGDLDLYVSDYVEVDRRVLLAEKPRQTYRDVSVFFGPLGLEPADDHFYVQERPGVWRDVSSKVGIAGERRFGFQVVPFDHDQDGWIDVYVANDSVGNLMWRNVEGERFEDVAMRAGLALSMDGVAQAGMGTTVGDYDGDLVADLYVTNFAEDYFTLYRGEGGGRYRDVTSREKLRIATTGSLGWACGFVDFDSDGDQDLFAVNGHVYPQVDLVDLGTAYRQKNLLFENLGGGRMRRPVDGGGPGFEAETASRAAAVADFDDDGDMDLLVGNLDEPPTLLENRTPSPGGWVKVRLVGAGGNRDAIGAQVTLRFADPAAPGGERRSVRWVGAGDGFLSSADPRLHFGLGQAGAARGIEVVWPDGSVESVADVPAGTLVTIRRGEGDVGRTPLR